MSRVTVHWTAEDRGVRHAFRPRRSMTLCGRRVDERFARNDMPRCPDCEAEVQRQEAMPAQR